ncbi:MAG: GMC oxidoreductase [Dermatophilaceae bacterium]
MAFDVVVVGGGSAGCVAAARLSGAGRLRVLLIEAGPDYASVGQLPGDVADASAPTTEHDWGFVSEPDDSGRTIGLPRGRLIGGCSATNGAFLMRGWPDDYDRWAAAGNPGWSFEELLPYFRDLESDADVDNEWHGRSGPVPVHRPAYHELSPLQLAFVDSACAAGHPLVFDHNRPGAIGVGSLPRNVSDGLRMSAALTHLAPARARPNLTVRSGTVVNRVEFSGTAAVGVRLAGGEVVEGDRVLLTAGTYCSPAILMRSGIGPSTELAQHGIPVRVDLPGVGVGLADHPLVGVDLPTSPGYTGPRFQTMLTMRSRYADPDGPPDLHLFAAGPFDDAASPAGGVFGVVTGLLSPSSRGTVRLRSAEPDDPPRIDIGHLRTAEDVRRMVDATRHARMLSRTPPLADFVRGAELAPGPAIDQDDDDNEGLAASIRARVASYHHPVGTCAMGPGPAEGAVVDSTGAVHGTDGLWVADASVMPSLPAANTNLTTMVVGDRIASWMLAG